MNEKNYASAGDRFLAAFIDGILIFVASIFFFIFDSLLKVSGANSLIPILSIIYFFVMTGYSGQTVGKKIMKIKVVTDQGLPLGYGKAFMREIVGKTVDGLTFLIGYLLFFFNPQKKMLHDFIAGTIVVKIGSNTFVPAGSGQAMPTAVVASAQQPSVEPAVKSKTNVVALILAVAVILLIISGLFIPLVLRNISTNHSSNTPVSVATNIPSIPAGSNLSYKNPTYGFSFSYPNQFQLKEVSSTAEVLDETVNGQPIEITLTVFDSTNSPYTTTSDLTDGLISRLQNDNPSYSFTDKAPFSAVTGANMDLSGYNFSYTTVTSTGVANDTIEKIVNVFASPDGKYMITVQLAAPHAIISSTSPVLDSILKSFTF